MAILSNVPHVEVRVLVNGQVAEEYPQQDQSVECLPGSYPDHACYIESKSGQNYFVRVTVAPEMQVSPGRALRAEVSIDGRHISSRTFIRSSGHRTQQLFDFKSNLAPSSLPGQLIQQLFMFSSVSSVEEASQDQVKLDQSIAKDLGTIVVRLYTCRVQEKKEKGKGHRNDGNRTSHASSSQPGLVSAERDSERGIVLAEKAMKGKILSHGTSYTQGQAITSTSHNGPTYVFHDRKSIGTYIFHYRSRSALQKEMVIPSTPAPEQPPAAQILDSSSKEGIQFQSGDILGIKPDTEVKKETIRLGQKRVIDLTDDSSTNFAQSKRHKMIKLEDGTEVIDLTE